MSDQTITKPKNYYGVLTLFAYFAAAFLGMGTYDISVHFSPPLVNFLLFSVPRELIGILSILVVDGLYILLDFMLPHYKTRSTRTAALYFMVVMWIIMASANISSAVINNTIGSALGGFSWVVYGVKMGALIFLAFYTYARWDDPETQRQIIGIELDSNMDIQINAFEKKYGAAVGKFGGEMVGFVNALEKYRVIFETKTGRDIRVTLGDRWQRALAHQVGFHVPDGFTFSDEPIVLDADDAGNAGNLPSPSKKKAKAQVDAGKQPPASDAGNLHEPAPLPLDAGSQSIPVGADPGYVQAALKSLKSLIPGLNKANP